MSDHFQYHASIALLALFAAVVVQRSPAIRWRSPLAVLLAIPVLFLLGFLTYSRCGVYRDSMTLWTDTLERNPSAWMAHTNLAALLDGQGRSPEGLLHHVRSTELKPDDPFLYSNLGAALLRSGDIRSAITTFERGLRCPMIAPSDSAKLNNALGAARYALGDRDRAISHFRQAIVDNPLLADCAFQSWNGPCLRWAQRRGDRRTPHRTSTEPQRCADPQLYGPIDQCWKFH